MILKHSLSLVYNRKVAGWQSGHAAACKAVYAGSIPASASIKNKYISSSLGMEARESK